MTRYDFLTFGENMIRLSTQHHERLEQSRALDLGHGGTEANTAVALARLGYHTAWVSRMSDNPLGRRIANDLRTWGVDTQNIIWTNDARVGTFFLEIGATPRASSVTYDRRDSAMSRMQTSEFPWALLAETRWLHVTGITAAISPTCQALVVEAVERAHAAGLPVSVDINYRARLWTTEQARSVLAPLCRDADFMFVTQADAKRVFGVDGADAAEILRALGSKFARQMVVMTMGARGAAALDKRTQEIVQISAFPVPDTVDRIGAGDAFVAGFIAGFWEEGVAKGLTLGNAMAALKMTIRGDYALVSRAEAEELLAGRAGGITR